MQGGGAEARANLLARAAKFNLPARSGNISPWALPRAREFSPSGLRSLNLIRVFGYRGVSCNSLEQGET